jgi:DNA-binding CsgD family transcriptional regulator
MAPTKIPKPVPQFPAIVDPPWLTPRQRQVLWLTLMGHTPRAIALALGISPVTVRTHLAAIRAHFREAISAPARKRQTAGPVPRTELHPALTPRQREIVRLVAGGCTSYQIGRLLGLAEKTVEGHRSRLAAALGDGHADIAGLTRLALSEGWLER